MRKSAGVNSSPAHQSFFSPSRTLEAQEAVEAAKFELGQEDRSGGSTDIDQGLADLPAGYGESRIVLMPRDPQWAYTGIFPMITREDCDDKGTTTGAANRRY